ncbi:metallophosphoesterase [Micromonospora sp. NPDC049559]|uniref:metallophosphoesterase n=1 Tax=Micromonospora sp. NPDC049559 TaxID=3155923 RepID=UPI003413573B
MAPLWFLAALTLGAGLVHLYLWKRLVRDTTRPGTGRRLGSAALVLLGVAVPTTLIGTEAGLLWLTWPGYLWLALMFYLVLVLLALEAPVLAVRLLLRRRARAATARPVPQPAAVGNTATVERPTAEAVATIAPPEETVAPPAEGGAGASRVGPEHDPGRRLLLARGAAIVAGLTATGVTGYGVRVATGPPRLDRVRIPLAKLPRRMDGLRIATVSDIHLGPLNGRAHAERIVAAINRLDADLVAVVGDLVDGTVEALGPAAAPLRGLRSRYGSFFVTGNHEYYSGAAEWIAEVDRLGLRVLQNERTGIVTPGGVLDLAGINDLVATERGAPGPDFDAALGDRDTSRPVVLLAHQPVQVREAARHGVDLQLSGHTHGGQFWPFDYVVRLEQPVVSGLATIDGTRLYVTNGAGFWGPPVRVGAPPQVTLVELRSTA